MKLWAAVLIAIVVLTSCARHPEQPEEVRPVRAERVTPALASENTGYSGEVRPRYETRLAFRVPGKIVSRHAEVGQTVRRGQLLARIDAHDLQLSEAALRAQVGAAQAELDLATAELQRYQDLRAKNFISQAELDRRSNAYATSKARLDQARAQVAQGGNQSSYAALTADADGVITAVEAEAGQVVAAGQTVMRLARTQEKEVVISVPEQRVDDLKRAAKIEVRLWTKPEQAYTARVREIAPASDPVTRTFTVKIAVPQAGEEMRLGMTASVELHNHDAAPRIRLPISALYEKNSEPAVWIVDPDQRTVNLAPVRTAGVSRNDFVVDSGLAPGQLVVTAGVHLLRPGQKVRLLDEAK